MGRPRGEAPKTRPKFSREEGWMTLRSRAEKKWGGPGAAPRNQPQVSQGGTVNTMGHYEHPLVDPQVTHFRQVPFRTKVKLPHSEHESPS